MLPTFDPWFAAGVAADVWAAGRGDPSGIARRQARRLRQLFEAAAKGSRLYRQHLLPRDPGATPHAQLPVLRKSELMRHFADWVTDPALDLGELRRFAASGACVGQAFRDRYVVWE